MAAFLAQSKHCCDKASKVSTNGQEVALLNSVLKAASDITSSQSQDLNGRDTQKKMSALVE